MAHSKAVKQGNVQERVATDGAVLAAEHYEGPLPHPQILAQYNAIVPGSAQAIIDDFKTNTESIRELRKIELEAAIERDKRGQWMAFALGLLTLGVAVLAITFDYPWVAGGSLFITVATITANIAQKNKK